ncbi:MAG: alpha/beta fold hydrolase [Pseudomonadota bacterium]
MIQWHGVQRSFYLHRPEDLQSLAPLVIVLHGLGGSAEKLRFGLGFNQLANQKKFAVVYPQGLPAGNASSHWNPGFDFSTVDDLGFLVTLKRFLTRQYDLNDRRVFVVGVSNGGYMAYHLACHAPEHFAAFVSVIGTIGGADWRKCQPRRAIPLMHIHGTEDPMIRYDGIPSWYSGWGGQPDVHSVVTSWAQRVGASLYDTNTTRPNTTAIKYRNPETQAEVWLMRLNGFGHDWPHSGNIGYNMTEEIWKFFETVPYR